MKPKFRFFSCILALLLLVCLPVLASCGTDGTTTDGITSEETVSEPETTTAGNEAETTPTATEFTVTFTLDDHVTVTVYKTQSDMTNAENGETVTVACARDKESGEVLTDGEGQVNFLLTFDEGYELDAITVESADNYNNLKGSSDTGVANGYRITKITGDLTVTVTAKVIEAETAADLEAAYSATFVLGEHVSVVVYKTQTDLLNGTNGEENATVAYARNADDGKLLTDGNGQINFVLVFDEGYELDSLTVTAGTYNKIKNPAESTVENSVRVTKITADTTVTVTVKATA